jgi:cAMP phosphodiesterase
VNITLVPSATGVQGGERYQFLSSYLVNDAVALDAGCLGLYRDPQEQARVKHVFLSHAHIDHLAALPVFMENAYEAGGDCVTVYGSAAVLDALQRDVFNGRIWPDMIALSRTEGPFLQLETLEAGRPVTVAGLRVTPVPVNHVVPTFGFIIEDAAAAVVIPSDTGPTYEIWERANRLPHLKAVFLEATFPNHLSRLADVAKHLTPALFARELHKLTRPAAVIAVHIKPRFFDQVVQELQALNLPGLEIGRLEKRYTF